MAYICDSYDEKSKSIVYLNSSYLKDINSHWMKDDETPVDMYDIEQIGNSSSIDVSTSIIKYKEKNVLSQ